MKDIRFKPINIVIGKYRICAFNGSHLENIEVISKEVYRILSDERTLKYIPEKRLSNVKDASALLLTTILNFHAGRNYLHIIYSANSGEILGMIDILSPTLVKAHYRLSEYNYFIEFYLKAEAQGVKIMSEILPAIINKMKAQGVKKVAAVADRRNIAARRVLIKSGFTPSGTFDSTKDIFEAKDIADIKFNNYAESPVLTKCHTSSSSDS